jgi:glucose/arabinose dehydrogenase
MILIWAALLLVGCSIGSRTPQQLANEPTAPTTVPLTAPTQAVPSVAPTDVEPTAEIATASATAESITTTTAPSTAPAAVTEVAAPPNPVQLPPGFGISVYAEGLGKARFMAYSPEGVLHVTDQTGGRVLALPDADQNGIADETQVVLEGLRLPHGIAFHEQALYIGEPSRIIKFDRDADGSWGQAQVVVPELPTGGHNTRTVLFGSDGKMYVSIGSSCNVCIENTPLRAAVWQYNPDGSDGRLFTAGLRNAVGIVERPGTDEIWATNNGRDMLGDDLPPETVNVLADGADFGWPRCHSGRIVDPEFGQQGGCEGVKAPEVEMQAHSAPLGLRFYDGTMFPEQYQGDLFVAFHGSWNRSVPTGYKVVRIPVDEQGSAGPVEDFAVGWLQNNGDNWGRPVDVLVAPDGALLVSDDGGGRIYRIFYQG